MEPTYSDAWFETFARPEDAQTEREVAFLLGVLPPPPASVLDVPCGFGRHARGLSSRGYRVTGVEKNEAVAAEARLHTTLDYEDGSRDVFEWRLYAPEELRALAPEVGLDCEGACAGYELAAAPTGETARMQVIFRRR